MKWRLKAICPAKYSKKIYSPLLKFRTSNHKRPVKRGRWEKKEHNECVCTICNRNMIGDEFHYVLECEAFKEERHALVKHYFYKHPNVLKYSELMNNSNDTIIRNLSKFVGLIMKKFKIFSYLQSRLGYIVYMYMQRTVII